MSGPGEDGTPLGAAGAAAGEESAVVPGIEWADVGSSAVASVGLDEEAQEIHVVFVRGGEYVFPGGREDWEGLLAAPSVGRAVNAMLGRG